VVLSGGSAFGLATADGVSRWCEAQGIGYDKAVARIPIVGGAIVFDLRVPGAPRPDADAGWAACEAASEADPAMGLVGVGAGCTVGKTAGLEWLSPGGVGWAVVSGSGVTVGALMAVNALGDVLDERGAVLAGSRAPDDRARFPLIGPPTSSAPSASSASSRPRRPRVLGVLRVLGALGSSASSASSAPAEVEHTVIGCLVTDARLSKTDACRAADLAHTGIARSIEPPHTTFDGDALFLLCAQRVETSLDLVAHLGAQAVAAAVRAAVRASAS
jgi:L-aminopeptidase/D-esterase-like protein